MKMELGRLFSSISLAAALMLGVVHDALGHRNPPSCGVGTSIGMNVFADSNATMDVSGQTLSPGQTVYYRVTLSQSDSQCAFEGGTITVTTPDGVSHNATPGGGIPLICGDPSCSPSGVASINSVLIAYTVNSSDAGVQRAPFPCPGNASIQIQSVGSYSNGVSHCNGGDSCNPSALVTLCSPIPIGTNSWIDSSSKWEVATNWSLGIAPATNGQPSIVITNAGGNIVTIDATTVLSNAINGCMTINDLTISNNTLQLTNAGTTTPLEISRINVISFRVTSGSTVVIRNSFLRTRTITTMDGNLLLDSGLLIITNSAVGATLYVGLSTPASVTMSNGTMVTDNFRVISGSASLAGGTNVTEGSFENFGSTLINGGTVICTNEFTAIRSPGQTTVSNGTVVANSLEVSLDYNQSGTLTLAGGAVDAGEMFLGGAYGPSAPLTGTVWIVGSSAVLTVTNGTTTIGSAGACFPVCSGVGRVTVSNGVWRARDVGVGSVTNSQGTLTMAGGIMTVSSNLTIGICAVGGATGAVSVAGGSLFVTNAAGNAVLNVKSGTLTLDSGTLTVDTLVMTNACGRFVRTGGTLVVSNEILSAGLDADGDGLPNAWELQYGLDPFDPSGGNGASADPDNDGLSNAEEYALGLNPTVDDFVVTAVNVQSNDIRITWTTFGGKTNRVFVSSSLDTNTFTALSPLIIIPGSGVVTTNYLDVGGATNPPPRFYVVRLATAIQPVRFLFDAGHAQSAGNADWVIDADVRNIAWNNAGTFTLTGNDSNAQRIPTPPASGIVSNTAETYWSGALSAWAVDLVKRGHSVETLPAGATFTYNTADSQDLTNYDVVVVDEPNILFTLAEKQALLSFVSNGGSLFMISDHSNSDRNGDGVDSPIIWMDFLTNNLVTNNPFGIMFPTSDASGINTFNHNILGDPILNGPVGLATNVAYFNGNQFQIDHTKNSTVTSHMWFGTAADSNNLCAVASLSYGKGRVVVVGDSSPIEDGTGDPGDSLFNGYTGDLGPIQRIWILNASEWLAEPFK